MRDFERANPRGLTEVAEVERVRGLAFEYWPEDGESALKLRCPECGRPHACLPSGRDPGLLYVCHPDGGPCRIVRRRLPEGYTVMSTSCSLAIIRAATMDPNG